MGDYLIIYKLDGKVDYMVITDVMSVNGSDGGVLFTDSDDRTYFFPVTQIITYYQLGKEKTLTFDTEEDMVNHPSHYQIGGVETVDIIRELLSEEEFIGYLKGTLIKYRERHPYKGKATQDLEKAKWFWDRLQEVKENECWW